MPKETNNKKLDQDVEANKTLAALSYIWILFLIPLLTKRDSKFAQFHAKQGLVLFIIEIFSGLIIWFPLFGQLFALFLVITSVMGAVKAYNGEWWEMPAVYEWSKKVKL
jgi:uncharacterized membrane protein